jgi:dTDP-D-glucose 4,6-dehydratase
VTKVLLTGAAGFTGAHMLRHLLVNTNWDVICPVTFRHRGNTDRIASAIQNNERWHRRVRVDMVDLTAPISSTVVDRWGQIDYILNVASESHVDRSIDDPVPFVRNNVDLILNVLEYARQVQPRLFLQMSTDEVFGPAPGGYDYREWDPLIPSNPYSASKAAQESIAISYWRAYAVPVIITNCWDMDTRLLTENGLRSYDEVSEGDLVWTLDENEQLVLQPVVRKVRMRGPERMVRIQSRSVSQLVTPNHRVMIRRQTYPDRTATWGPIEETHAENLLDMGGKRVLIPRTGEWVGNDSPTYDPTQLTDLGEIPRRRRKYAAYELSEMSADLLAELFGWFISEGYTSGNDVFIGALKGDQPERIERLLANFGEPNRGERFVRLNHAQLARLVETTGHGAHNKRIPNFIRNMAPKYLQVFLDAAIDGDGTRYGTGARIYTCSELLAADYAEVAMKCGYAASIVQRRTLNPKRTKWNTSYFVRIHARTDSQIYGNHVTEESYDGDVWCVSVASGRVFAERDGRIALTGQTMNLFGEMQHPEKYFAKIIRCVFRGEPVPVHVGPNGEMGSRFYIHARNFSDAWLHLIGRYGSETTCDENTCCGTLPMFPLGDDRPARYNIVGDREVNNLELAQIIADRMGKPLKWEPVNFHSSRPGHDLRYALNGEKLAATGWKSPTTFEDSVNRTVDWMINHPEWLGE